MSYSAPDDSIIAVVEVSDDDTPSNHPPHTVPVRPAPTAQPAAGRRGSFTFAQSLADDDTFFADLEKDAEQQFDDIKHAKEREQAAAAKAAEQQQREQERELEGEVGEEVDPSTHVGRMKLLSREYRASLKKNPQEVSSSNRIFHCLQLMDQVLTEKVAESFRSRVLPAMQRSNPLLSGEGEATQTLVAAEEAKFVRGMLQDLTPLSKDDVVPTAAERNPVLESQLRSMVARF